MLKVVSEFVEQVLTAAEHKSRDQVLKIVLGGLFTILFLNIALLYYFYSAERTLLTRWQNLDKQACKVVDLAARKARLDEQKGELDGLLATALPQEIKLWLSQLAQQNGIELEEGWQAGSEVQGLAQLKNAEEELVKLPLVRLTTRQLVDFLDMLTQQPAIAVKELEIKHLGEALSAELLVSHRRAKKQA